MMSENLKGPKGYYVSKLATNLACIVVLATTSYSYLAQADSPCEAGAIVEVASLSELDFRKQSPSSIHTAKYILNQENEALAMYSAYEILGEVAQGFEAYVCKVRNLNTGEVRALRVPRSGQNTLYTLALIGLPESPLLPLEYGASPTLDGVLSVMPLGTPLVTGSDYRIHPELLSRYSPLEVVQKLVLDILPQITFLNEIELYHGDIKPHNIIYREETDKFYLIDLQDPFPVGESHVKSTRKFAPPGFFLVDFTFFKRYALAADLHGLSATVTFLSEALLKDTSNGISPDDRSSIQAIVDELQFFKKEWRLGSSPRLPLPLSIYWANLKRHYGLSFFSDKGEVIEAFQGWVESTLGTTKCWESLTKKEGPDTLVTGP